MATLRLSPAEVIALAGRAAVARAGPGQREETQALPAAAGPRGRSWGLERQEGPWGEHSEAEGKDVQLSVLLLCLFFIFRVFFK